MAISQAMQNPGLLAMLSQSLSQQNQTPTTTDQTQPASTYAPQGLGGSDLSVLSGAPTTQAPPLTVTAKPRTTNLNNNPELTQAQGVINQYPQDQANQAPRSIHGTLGTILGHLGDAFLVGSGRAPEYVPRMDQMKLAQASVGAEIDPRAAAARVAATGVPGAADMAQKLIDQANQVDLRKQIQNQNFQYQQSRINEQSQNNFARQAPTAIGSVRGITDPNKYNQLYGLWSQRAQAVDPNAEATSAYGLPSPDQGKPGMLDPSFGMTANQQTISEDKEAQRKVSVQDTNTNARARLGSASIMANAHLRGIQPSETGYLSGLIDKQNQGQQLTPAEQMYFNHYTAPPKTGSGNIPGGLTIGGGKPAVPITMVGNNNPVANAGKPVTPEQARTLPKGTHFLTSDGRWLVR